MTWRVFSRKSPSARSELLGSRFSVIPGMGIRYEPFVNLIEAPSTGNDETGTTDKSNVIRCLLLICLFQQSVNRVWSGFSGTKYLRFLES